MGSAYGSIFEAALNEGLKLESSQDVLGSNLAGGDFDVHSVNKELSDLFGGIPGKRADYKASERQDPNYFSMAKKIASAPPNAIKAMKKNLNNSISLNLEQGLRAEAEDTIEAISGDEHRLAVKEFLNRKRK